MYWSCNRNNPLKFHPPNLGLAHPPSPELIKLFLRDVGRNITLEDKLGLHVSINLFEAAAYLDGDGVIFSIDITGLKSELDFEHLIFKHALQREIKCKILLVIYEN